MVSQTHENLPKIACCDTHALSFWIWVVIQNEAPEENNVGYGIAMV